MDAPTSNVQTQGGVNSRGARRLIAVFAGALAFLGIASLIKPDPRSATASGIPSVESRVLRASGNGAARPRVLESSENDVTARLAATVHPKGWKLLGQLEGREYHVLMFTSPDGPRYSVYTLQGNLLAPDLAADEVYRVFPGLDLTTLHDIPSDGSKTIMLAEPVGQ